MRARWYTNNAANAIEQLQLRHENTWQSTSVWQKKYCAQWQLKGSRCLTHDLCDLEYNAVQKSVNNLQKLGQLSTLLLRPSFTVVV